MAGQPIDGSWNGLTFNDAEILGPWLVGGLLGLFLLDLLAKRFLKLDFSPLPDSLQGHFRPQSYPLRFLPPGGSYFAGVVLLSDPFIDAVNIATMAQDHKSRPQALWTGFAIVLTLVLQVWTLCDRNSIEMLAWHVPWHEVRRTAKQGGVSTVRWAYVRGFEYGVEGLFVGIVATYGILCVDSPSPIQVVFAIAGVLSSVKSVYALSLSNMLGGGSPDTARDIARTCVAKAERPYAFLAMRLFCLSAAAAGITSFAVVAHATHPALLPLLALPVAFAVATERNMVLPIERPCLRLSRFDPIREQESIPECWIWTLVRVAGAYAFPETILTPGGTQHSPLGFEERPTSTRHHYISTVLLYSSAAAACCSAELPCFGGLCGEGQQHMGSAAFASEFLTPAAALLRGDLTRAELPRACMRVVVLCLAVAGATGVLLGSAGVLLCSPRAYLDASAIVSGVKAFADQEQERARQEQTERWRAGEDYEDQDLKDRVRLATEHGGECLSTLRVYDSRMLGRARALGDLLEEWACEQEGDSIRYTEMEASASDPDSKTDTSTS